MASRPRSSRTPFLDSKLRLCLSADLVGFTAFKQRDSGTPSIKTSATNASGKAQLGEWQIANVSFYREMKRHLQSEWQTFADQLAPKADLKIGSPPSFWKTRGDEVLFVKEINHHTEAFSCIHAWRSAIHKIRKYLDQKYSPLSVKCAAWLAGFPVNNFEVATAGDDRQIDHSLDDEEPYILICALWMFFIKGSKQRVVSISSGPPSISASGLPNMLGRGK
jgi:hypothetical protein